MPQKRGFADRLPQFEIDGSDTRNGVRADDMVVPVAAGSGWIFLRNEFRAPAASTEACRLRVGDRANLETLLEFTL